MRAHIDEWHALAKRKEDFEDKAREEPPTYASLAFGYIRAHRHIRPLLGKPFGVKGRYFGIRSEQYVACGDRFAYYRSRHPQDYYNYAQLGCMSKLLRMLDVEWAVRYESQTTNLPEQIFGAVVSNDGAHNVRFERALCT